MHMNKNKIYNKYMKILDKDYIPNFEEEDREFYNLCSVCYIEMLLNQNTGMLICPKCGMVEKMVEQHAFARFLKVL